MKALRLCVLGGTGFIGSHLVYRLAGLGHSVTVLTRRPERHREFRIGSTVRLLETNPYDAAALQAAIQDMDCVINLVGILNEEGKSSFQGAHVDLPRTLVKVMRAAGVTRLLHMSALNANVNESHSRYLKSKGQGEDLVHQTPGLEVTSFRPSVVFGPGDSFFNRFAQLLHLSPPLFPLACAGSRFAPVYVGDVTDAFVRALDDDSLIGQRLELCGPKAYSLQQLVQYTAQVTGHKTRVVGLPDFAARIQGHMLGLVPGKPFTIDNYYSLQRDSVCKEPTLAILGITPRSVEAIVPTYLGDSYSRAHYVRYRSQARRP
ncbi:MAG: complex I NDUFA9 subunit family protein [Gammaproteobacteria bacterium]|nr:MAG: complex I NDUFA9 subunit family protein [Gammaproteobacteria bacterium]